MPQPICQDGAVAKRVLRIIFDDPERDSRVVAYADRYAADRHGEPEK